MRKDERVQGPSVSVAERRIQSPKLIHRMQRSSLGRYVFGSEISYNKAPPRLPGLGC